MKAAVIVLLAAVCVAAVLPLPGYMILGETPPDWAEWVVTPIEGVDGTYRPVYSSRRPRIKGQMIWTTQEGRQLIFLLQQDRSWVVREL